MKLTTALLLLILLVLLAPCVFGKLQSASVLFRHGDRSPLHTFPSNPTPPTAWPRGFGQLSAIGARQLRHLGAFLRHRYAALLHRPPLPRLLRSTRTSRTLASARNCLAGLLRKRPAQVTLVSPVRIVAPQRSRDDLLSLAKHCPRLQQIRHEVESSSEAHFQLQPFSQFLTWLGLRAGYSGPMTLRRASHVRDAIICARAHNRTTPAWMTAQAWRRLVAVKELAWRLRFRTLDQRRRQGGPLLSRLLGDFATDAAAKKGYLRLYSAHDSNVGALLASAHIFNWKHPPYASAVLVELHSDPSGVEFYYRNDSAASPYRLTVPGCKARCPLEDLRRLLRRELLPEVNVRESCALPKAYKRSFFGFFFLLTLGLCAAVVVGLFFLVRRGRSPPPRYMRVPMQDEEAL